MTPRWIRAALRSLTTPRPTPPAGRRAGVRPRLEPLGDRCLPSFSPATAFPAGTTPQAVATADLDNDGKLDLVTANSDDGTVSVLLGDGAGGFGPATDFPAGSVPSSVAVGDFNDDGIPDLATGNRGGWDVAVLLGNGDGSFQPPASTPLWTGEPQSVAVGDFNADGTMDLAVSTHYFYALYGYDYGYVEVLMGDGQGGFTEHTWYDVVSVPVGLTVADLNADGHPDVVTANEDYGLVTVLLGNGDFTFSVAGYFATGPGPRAAAVGDFTGDGFLDILTVGQGVDVLPGNGAGTFAGPVHSYSGGPGLTAVAAADFNGDGKLDAVAADPAAGTVSALLGWGDGTFSLVADHAAGSAPVSVAAGDFNKDGRPDAAAASAGSGAASVLLNDGDWPVLAARLLVGDVTVTEGNAGTVRADFTVRLSGPSDQPVTVRYATATGTAAAGTDFQSAAGTLTFAPGETSKTVTVLVTGDRRPEPTETFYVRLTDPVNAPIGDGEGVGTVRDDEPRLAITGASVKEGHHGTTVMTFTVTLSAAYDQAVTVNFTTRDGTARVSDHDYTARSGTLTFAPGETTKTITVTVKGDKKREADETFFVDLSGPSTNALVSVPRGVGTILNDDL
jgi:hypothetical protein